MFEGLLKSVSTGPLHLNFPPPQQRLRGWEGEQPGGGPQLTQDLLHLTSFSAIKRENGELGGVVVRVVFFNWGRSTASPWEVASGFHHILLFSLISLTSPSLSKHFFISTYKLLSFFLSSCISTAVINEVNESSQDPEWESEPVSSHATLC